MATPILGKEMTLIFDSSVFAYCTDFTLNLDKTTVDITSISSNGWKDLKAMDKSWSIDFNGMVSRTAASDSSRGFEYMINSLVSSDASVLCAIKPSISGNTYYQGGAYITSVKMQGGVGKAVTFSGKLDGTGTLSSTTA